MKRYCFIQVWPFAFLAIASLFILSSCVTKKKYMVMEDSKNRSEIKVKELTSEVESLKKDFEDYQISSTNNLKSKQDYADSLSRIVSLLNTDISSKTNNIEDQVFSFQIEKDKLNKEMSEKDNEIRNLTREVNTLKIQIDDLNRKIEDATSNRKFPFGQVKQLERKLQARDTEISDLNSKLGNLQTENSTLSAKIKDLNLEIERLNGILNPVKLDSIGGE
jgi:chromosome segregation ATPase